MRTYTRREMLRMAAAVVPVAFLSSWFGRIAHAAAKFRIPGAVTAPGYVYLKPAEIKFLDAAVDRLIPADYFGPGARDAGVTLFIDHQLNGPYGHAARWYMEGPWADGTPEQGYQLKYTPAQLYRIAIKHVDDYCRKTFDNRTFAELDDDDKDNVLRRLEAGKVDLADVPSATFFDFLMHNTRNGFLSDPIYGGNRDFAGWKLLGFPGPRYNYADDITRYGVPYDKPTVGLMGRDGSPLAKT
ncbi:MAG TPA: gluconate 2-dehydrogenase subunit 3 family protein [Burkholderiales bacterium]|nr:gluconate 2-dehydrogenase subunit 3 family protein [Burkholderiales bacterium]